MPMLSAKESIPAKKLRGWPAQSGTLTARTVLRWKGLNAVPSKISVISTISSGLRRSGLSVPYFSMDSA